MFPKHIRVLLKFYDMCGFYTETTGQSGPICPFLFHGTWVFMITCFTIACSMEPMIIGDNLPYLVNELLQIMNGILVYGMVIVESYLQRKTQQKFWLIYKRIETLRDYCKSKFLCIYIFKVIEFVTAVTIMQTYFTQHFTHYVKHYSLFRIVYLCSQIVYQIRVFHYLFYLELIRFELKTIKNELKNAVELSEFRNTFSCRIDRRSYGCYTVLECFNEKTLERINAYCQFVFQLRSCINQMFGWSNFFTIIYCFHLPLTDGNWALKGLYERDGDYIIGILKELLPKLFRLLYLDIFEVFLFSIRF